MNNLKKCTLCGGVKPLDDFYKRASMEDGHRSECKACNNTKRTERKNISSSQAHVTDISAPKRNFALHWLIVVTAMSLTVIGWIWK